MIIVEKNGTVSTTAGESKSKDLSPIIVKSASRLPGETLRCIRISETHYRCNWWIKEESGIGGRISRSAFLRAVHGPDGLMIQYLSSRGAVISAVA